MALEIPPQHDAGRVDDLDPLLLFRWLLEPMLAAAGFTIVTAEFDRSVYGIYMCVKER